jgi:hypothetical protein
MEVAMPRPVSKSGSTKKFKQGLDELNRIGQPKSERGRARRNTVEGETARHGLPVLEDGSKGRPKGQENRNVKKDEYPTKGPR